MRWVVRGLLIIAALLTSVNALAQERSPLLPHTSEGYGYESVVPEGWTDVGQGIFARQRDAEDPTLLAQQSALVSAEDVLASLLPQLRLTETPQSVGTHQGDTLEWTLYQVDVALGEGEVAVDLALSDEEGTTYIVLLQSAPDEHDALYASIFLPTLNAFAPLVETVQDVPYRVEAVTFGNGEVTLAGTLTLPPTPGPHPAVVLVSGSGPQDRDETLGGGIAIKPFRLLADALTREGVAVLRYDDRGVGASTGTFSTAVVSDFASDAEAAIDYLLTREEIDPQQIGLLGHSEGGLVAAMLGARNDDLDFIIILAGPGVNGRDLLLVQNQRILEAEGATQEQIDAQLAFVEELTTVLDDPAAVEALVYARTLEQAEALPGAERAAIGDLEDYAHMVTKQAMSEFGTDWFASFLAYDPSPDWAQTTLPVLAIFGGKDVQVDAEQNAPALEDALKRAGNDDVEIAVLPNANHLFQDAQTGSPREYATLPAEFTPDLVPTIVNWLQDHLETAA
jgi:pimeloyl-ACP methyl ester carboxylesterase